MNPKTSVSRIFRSESEWKRLIDEWLKSGQSPTVFARENKLAESGLYNWRKRFYPNINVTKSKPEMRKSDLFVPVTLTNASIASPKVTLIYPNGCQLQITGLNDSVLKMLNQAMGV